jgi:hypothetical protein
MHNPQDQPPSPVLFFDTINAYSKSAIIKAAIELDVFTAIQEGSTTAAEIATSRSSSERGMRILLDNLVIMGFLTKEESSYQLTRDSAMFGVRTSPAYAGDTLDFLLSPELRGTFDDLATTVRRGTTVLEGEGTVTHENPIWIKFARAMGRMAFPAAQQIAGMANAAATGPMRVLDIAAGHGVYGIAFAMANPQAQIYALNWPKVLEVAQQNAERFGVAERFHQIPGSAFDQDYGDNYDIVLLTNFLHHFDKPTNETLLRRVHESLKPGGTAWTLDFIPNPDRVSPPVAASFSMTMLASTGSGDAYTFGELEQMHRNAGFMSARHQPLQMSFESLVIGQK